MASRDEGDLPARVQELAGRIAAELDAEVLDVQVKGGRGRRLVRVTADVADLTADYGLDVEAIAELSRRIGDALDEHDVVPGSYNLEVTTPGADRPLRRTRDFVRNIGRPVRVSRTEEHDPRDVTGTLIAASDASLTLDVDGEEVVVPLADVDHGKVVLPW